MNPEVPFIHLGARSEYSVGESIARVEDLCRQAARDNQPALALTDVNSLAAAPHFEASAKRAGIRPIFGTEISVRAEHPLADESQAGRVRLLAESETGFRNLTRLVNLAWEKAPDSPPHVEMEELLSSAQGLILLTGGRRGEITRLLQSGDFEGAEDYINRLREAFPAKNIFIELPDPIGDEAINQARLLSRAADFFRLRSVAVPSIRAATSPEEPLIRYLSGSQPIRRIRDILVPPEDRRCLVPRETAARRFQEFPLAVSATVEIAGRCAGLSIPRPSRRFRMHDFKRGEDAESFIWNTAFARATERYGDLPTRYKERLNREFHDLIECGLANALVSLCRLNEELEFRGVQRGPGAGFLTNSVVASLLGISRLDPLRFDLPFNLPESFGKGSFPRLEISIPSRQEAEAVEALETLFEGQVSAVGKWKRWSAGPLFLRITQRLGRDRKWINQIQKQPAFRKELERQKKYPPGKELSPDVLTESFEAIAWVKNGMEGRARFLERVPGLFAFSVEPMERIFPQRTVQAGTQCPISLRVLEWEDAELGKLHHGRLQFDHPPLLDLVGDATELVRSAGEADFSPELIPSDDAGAYRLLREGRTAGLPPLEPPTRRARLRQGQPSDLLTLIRLMADDNPVSKLPGSGLDLPAILLCHAGAVVKAHRPASFYAAALNQAHGDIRCTALILEEIQRRGMRINPVDINCSDWLWKPESEALRPGLRVVKALAPTAAREILLQRREMAFNDLAGFFHRLNRRVVKPDHLQALLDSGALDSIAGGRDGARSQFRQILPFLRPDKASASIPEEEEPFSFFGQNTAWWVEKYGSAEEDNHPGDESVSSREASNLEREAVGGIFLRDEAPRDLVRYLHGAGARRTRSLVLKDAGRVVSLLGVLGPIESDPQYPNAVLLDLGGCLVRLRDAGLVKSASDAGLAGERVLVTGPLERDPFQWRMEAVSLVRIDEAMEKANGLLWLQLDLSKVHEKNLKPLYSLLRSYPGGTPLRLSWRPEQSSLLAKRIARRRVLPCPILEFGLDRYAGPAAWSLVPLEDVAEMPKSRVIVPKISEAGGWLREKLAGVM